MEFVVRPSGESSQPQIIAPNHYELPPEGPNYEPGTLCEFVIYFDGA